MSFIDNMNSGVYLITGHYGCGKTNLTINLAIELAARGKKVSLVDVDIVNPYFRASDSTTLLESKGIEVVAPVFARSTLDTPSLSPAIMRSIERANSGECISLIDVGGDPDGAGALARFNKGIKSGDYKMAYVVNQRRLLTHTAEEATELLAEIEQISHLNATHIIANTHLGLDTTADVVLDAIPFAQEVSQATNLPLAFITATKSVYEEVEQKADDIEVFPVEIMVKTPWM